MPSRRRCARVIGMVGNGPGGEGEDLSAPALVLSVFTGVLMVSNVRFYSFKELDLRGRVPFVAVLVVVLVFVLISSDPPDGVVLSLLVLRGVGANHDAGADSAPEGRTTKRQSRWCERTAG